MGAADIRTATPQAPRPAPVGDGLGIRVDLRSPLREQPLQATRRLSRLDIVPSSQSIEQLVVRVNGTEPQ